MVFKQLLVALVGDDDLPKETSAILSNRTQNLVVPNLQPCGPALRKGQLMPLRRGGLAEKKRLLGKDGIEVIEGKVDKKYFYTFKN